MKNFLLTLTLFSQLLFSATSEQLEQYLLLSNSDEQLIMLEKEFSVMQENFKKDSNKSYDMQMLTIRFKESLQKQLSEDEMKEILDNYKNFTLLQFVSATSTFDYDDNTTQEYLKNLKQDEEANNRVTLVKKISQKFYNKEAILVLFNDLMKPLIKNSFKDKPLDEKILKSLQATYLENTIESSLNETLFATKEFSIEELEELLKIAKTPAIEHEVKAVFKAMAFCLKDFFLSISIGYNVEKHQTYEKK